MTVFRFAPVLGPTADNPATRYFRRPGGPDAARVRPALAGAARGGRLRGAAPRARPALGRRLQRRLADVLPLSAMIALAGTRPLPLPSPLARAILRALNAAGITSTPPTLLDYLHYTWVADGARCREVLGFEPRHSARRGAEDAEDLTDAQACPRERPLPAWRGRAHAGASARRCAARGGGGASSAEAHRAAPTAGEAGPAEAPPAPGTPRPGSGGRAERESPAPAVAQRPQATTEASALDLTTAVSVVRGAVEAVRSGLGSPADVELDVYGGDARLQAALQPLADFLYTRWFRVSVEGAEHVPPGGALLVANHAGGLPIDGPVLHQVLRRNRPELADSRWLVEDQVFYAPVLGTLLNRLGAVRASPENATRLLEEGRPVCVFPEGIQGIGKPFRGALPAEALRPRRVREAGAAHRASPSFRWPSLEARNPSPCSPSCPARSSVCPISR